MGTMNHRKRARWAAAATVAAAIATATGLTVASTVGGAKADATGQSYAVPCPASDEVTPALNANLIANPGAEDVTQLTTLGAPSNDTAYVPDCWTTGNTAQAAPYAVVEAEPYASYSTTTADPNAGSYFFWGGTNENGVSTTDTNYATQLISLGSLSVAGQPFELSGYLGGYETQSDNMSVTATFEDASGATLGSGQIGPVTEAERGGVTELLYQAWYGTIPAGTAQVLVSLNQTGSGVNSNGSADDLNLTIGSSAVPSGPVLQKLPYTATGTDGGLYRPAGVSAANGAVYASDTGDNVVSVLENGNTTAIAGSLEGFGDNGDGLNAGSSTLYQPAGTAEDANGDIFIADSGDNVVREITPDGVIHRFAGSGIPGSALIRGNAMFSQLDHPDAVAVNAAGDVYISDTYNNRVLEVTPQGFIRVVAGTGRPGYSGDGHPAVFASLNQPEGLAVDAQGNLYIADSANNVIREVSATTGIITTVAGDYAADQASDGLGGFSGDGGPATSAQLNDPQGVAVDGAGNLFIADTFNNAIREVNASTGIISTVVGVVGPNGAAPAPGSESSGAAPTASHLSGPYAVAVDQSTGTLYIADTHNSAIAEVLDVAQPAQS
jgi:hypothetical protein